MKILLPYIIAAGILTTQTSLAEVLTVTRSLGRGTGTLVAMVSKAKSGDTIVFDASLDGAELLPIEAIVINKSLAIDASALTTGITINVKGRFGGVIRIGKRATVSITGVTMKRGYSETEGGGIHNQGDLTLVRCTVVDSGAEEGGGGIYNLGVLTLERSIISGNRDDDGPGGGGVHNSASGTATISNSSVLGNSAENGGGIHNSGSMTINSSTISSNITHDDYGGAGISNFGLLTINNSTISGNADRGDEGGGIANRAMLTINNSTISGNVTEYAGGGIHNRGGILMLLNTTVSNNFADSNKPNGIHNTSGSTLTLINSIVAGNDSARMDLSGDGTVILKGMNLIGETPRLAPLGYYGGPTETMPPLPGSPAIEMGVLTEMVPETDQRGGPRIVGKAPDIGAVEAFSFSSIETLEDTDADGIPDILEPVYGLTVRTDDRMMDTDRDGHTDAIEIANMTNPLDPSDYLRILSIEKAQDQQGDSSVYDISVAVFPGLAYSLETNQDLRGPFTTVLDSLYTAREFTETIRVQLAQGRDHVRVRRLAE